MTTEKAIQHLTNVRKLAITYSPQEQKAFDMAFAALRAQTDFGGTYVNIVWLKQVEAERDAAVKYIPRGCGTCKWCRESGKMTRCEVPKELGPCYVGDRKAWEWRGVNDGKTNQP